MTGHLKLTRTASAALLATGLMAAPVYASPISTVFVIAMENHDWTEPNGLTTASPQQIQGNPAAPYINSLVTPGNANAQYSSYFSAMTNVGTGIHPSEPNYIWQNGGSNYGVLSDADPSAAANNIITSPSFTGQLTAKGIAWNNYQEDVQYSASATGLTSASGTGGTAPSGVTVTANPYYGTTQYNYAAKHNPAAFFTDSNTHPVKTFAQLTTDLTNNTYAAYNWITPNQYNDQHSALTGGFTYNGTLFTGDQASIAQGDSFLSKLIPAIEATTAFQTGTALIDIWWDESESGDTSAQTIPEILISKAAIGNGYNITTPETHSNDLGTMCAIFGVACVGQGADVSVGLQAGLQSGATPALPEPASMAVLLTGIFGLRAARRTRKA